MIVSTAEPAPAFFVGRRNSFALREFALLALIKIVRVERAR